MCDLPYGTTNCSWDSALPLDKMWTLYNRIIKPNGTIILFAAQPFTTQLINSNSKNFKYCWYWVKNTVTGFPFSHYQPLRKVEEICVFYREHGTYNPQGLQVIENSKPKSRKAPVDNVYSKGGLSNEYTPGFKNWPTNVLQFKKERGLHPTQKPVSLIEYLIKTYTNDGETILDNCMGSGSTGVAVKNVGNRHFIGIEANKIYFDIAEKRIRETK